MRIALLSILIAVLAASSHAAELSGFALIPAETYYSGPASGAYDQHGRRGEARFEGQPVQGFSSLVAGEEPGVVHALSDNGFGAKGNSIDYQLRWYTLLLRPQTADGGPGDVQIQRLNLLRDPSRHIVWPLLNGAGGRILHGGNFDPESFVRAPDGSYWVGEEFGPFLLHCDERGRLLAPPFAFLQDGSIAPVTNDGPDPTEMIASPQNPLWLLQGVGFGDPAVPQSGGFEGLAISPDGSTLYAMLEKTVTGDEEGVLRVYEVALNGDKPSVTTVHRYRLQDPSHAIGEIETLPGGGFLVIERDNLEGRDDAFKRIYKAALPADEGEMEKTLVVDLMDIANPHGLGEFGDPFTFPYWTIEAVLALDATTLLVCNDNNFPSEGARGDGVPNATEFIWIALDEPLYE